MLRSVGLLAGFLTLAPALCTPAGNNTPALMQAVSPSDIMKRSLVVMTTIRDVHASGSSWEKEVDFGDPDSTGSWTLQGNCASQGRGTIGRISIHGLLTDQHRRTVNEQITIRAGPYQANLERWWHSWTVWMRAAGRGGHWQRIAMTRHARLAATMCPSLLAPQLHSSLPGTLEYLGTTRINDQYAVHLISQSPAANQGGGGTIEFFVDSHSFRWVRVGLGGWGPGCCHSYSTTIDYSRFNVTVGTSLP
jgi:hypothetical protein